jgi:hypothetical protein
LTIFTAFQTGLITHIIVHKETIALKRAVTALSADILVEFILTCISKAFGVPTVAAANRFIHRHKIDDKNERTFSIPLLSE